MTICIVYAFNSILDYRNAYHISICTQLYLICEAACRLPQPLQNVLKYILFLQVCKAWVHLSQIWLLIGKVLSLENFVKDKFVQKCRCLIVDIFYAPIWTLAERINCGLFIPAVYLYYNLQMGRGVILYYFINILLNETYYLYIYLYVYKDNISLINKTIL